MQVLTGGLVKGAPLVFDLLAGTVRHSPHFFNGREVAGCL